MTEAERYIKAQYPTLAERVLGFELGQKHRLLSTALLNAVRFHCSCDGWEGTLPVFTPNVVPLLEEGYRKHVYEVLTGARPTLKDMADWGWYDSTVDP